MTMVQEPGNEVFTKYTHISKFFVDGLSFEEAMHYIKE
jgi:hypothetical protein